MAFMKIEVQVMGMRTTEQGKQYVELYFSGGSLSLSVVPDIAKELQKQIGKQIPAVFEMSPRLVVLFNRPVCLFEVQKLVSICDK